jgi:hypothetical protein
MPASGGQAAAVFRVATCMKHVAQKLLPEVGVSNSEYLPGPALQLKLFVRGPAANRSEFPCSATRWSGAIAEHALNTRNAEANDSFSMRSQTMLKEILRAKRRFESAVIVMIRHSTRFSELAMALSLLTGSVCVCKYVG